MAQVRTVLLAAALSAIVAPLPAIAQAPPQKPAVDITLVSKPTPPRMGNNTLEVTLKDATGKPITDAAVSVTFFMAAMPAMKMPEMKNTSALKHVKDGTYSGTGNVMMAGNWDVTVTATRAGKEIGTKKFPITAK
jgi:hypothetical protein